MSAPDKIYAWDERPDIIRGWALTNPFPIENIGAEYTLSSLTARWVSVKERLPEEGTVVLTDGKNIIIGRHATGLDLGFYNSLRATHWLDGVPPQPEGK